ncbi:hypothetical protein CRENPOLYSF1_1180023 [Crenothrix polyspora]|uniref:Uncharacterized protein n=1 Tax=Crenothrix polyspora TaxID=360316 RepID=A0A1R4H0E2_9GAMM|nr:hypothetical protein CRENPOLYSF1_1180023 [Crenothrix polyspora]
MCTLDSTLFPFIDIDQGIVLILTI